LLSPVKAAEKAAAPKEHKPKPPEGGTPPPSVH
jgi:hypothetical protein